MKPNKFGAKKSVYDGIKFDSKKEMQFYKSLLLQKKAIGKDRVLKIEVHPRYNIIVNNKKIGFYKADFKVSYADGVVKIFDVKGLKKGSAYQLFKLKKKLVDALYNIEIIEV